MLSINGWVMFVPFVVDGFLCVFVLGFLIVSTIGFVVANGHI